MEKTYDLKINLLILGDSTVGKTSLLLRYCDNYFTTSICPTIGVEFKTKSIEIDKKSIRICIYDTGGQEKYRSIAKSFYRGSDGILLAYSCSDRRSFDNVENWMRSIQQNADSGIGVVLVGNKKDLNDRDVSYDEGRALADRYNIEFFETSAKLDNDESINEAFYVLCKKIKVKMRSVNNSVIDGKNDKKLHGNGRNGIALNDNCECSTSNKVKCCNQNSIKENFFGDS